MNKRKLEELNLIDDFMFYTMLSHSGVGEEFSRNLLKIIFNREFGKLKVVPQKVYYGSDTDKHGARLDVYLEEDVDGEELLESATIYDVEPELNTKEKNLKNLPRRVRFYHSKIDAGILESGADYEALKRVIVIMILPEDPFGYDHVVYTIGNACEEIPELPYDDGAKTIFLYTKGKKGNPSKELKEFLHYMEETSLENAKNDTLKKIHKMVETVKKDSGVSVRYMKVLEREKMLVEQGIKQGREEEQANTEKERKRAEAAEQEIERLRDILESQGMYVAANR